LSLKNLAKKFKKFIEMKKKSIEELNKKVDIIFLKMIQYDESLKEEDKIFIKKKSKSFFKVKNDLLNFLFDYQHAKKILPFLKKKSKKKMIFFKESNLLDHIQNKYHFISKKFNKCQTISTKFFDYKKMLKNFDSFFEFSKFDNPKKNNIFTTAVSLNRELSLVLEKKDIKESLKQIFSKKDFVINIDKDFLFRIIFEIIIDV
jgi:hypothetical protein